MKTFFTVTLMVTVIFISGCSNDKLAEKPAHIEQKVVQPASETKEIDAVLVAGSFWVLDAENIHFLADALNRNDIEYLKQLVIEGKVFRVDNNTKVIQVDETTSTDIVKIHFKEGRYTNKDGCTFAYNTFAEPEFPAAYLASQKQAPLQLVQSVLASTENYFDFIKAEDVVALNQTLDFCNVVEKTLATEAENTQMDSATRGCIKDARKIIICRGAAVLGGLKIIEYKQASNDSQRRLAVETTYSFCKDAIKFRESFKNKYGF